MPEHQTSEGLKPQTEAEAALSFIQEAVAEYREPPYRSADWLAMQVMDALDGHLTPRPTPSVESMVERADLVERLGEFHDTMNGVQRYYMTAQTIRERQALLREARAAIASLPSGCIRASG